MSCLWFDILIAQEVGLTGDQPHHTWKFGRHLLEVDSVLMGKQQYPW